MEDTQAPDRSLRRHDLLFGLALIAVGSALLIDRLTPLSFDGRFWPLILLVLGGVKLAWPSGEGDRRSRRPGAWLMFIGLWGLVNEFHLLGLEYGTSWPLMIVGVGIMVIWRALEGPDICCQRVPGERRP
jgi:hypothetical protein